MNIGEYLVRISKYDMNEYFASFGEIEQALGSVAVYLEGRESVVVEAVLSDLTRDISLYPEWMGIHLLSFCMKISGTPQATERLVDAVIAADIDAVGEYNKLSHYWQIRSYVFTNDGASSPKVENKLGILYKTLADGFAEALGVRERSYIPVEQRNKDLVFVFSGQIMGLGHAPTKTLLDRCYVLQKILHKKVYIVNTAMFMPVKGMAPFYDLQEGYYESELQSWNQIRYKDEEFEFFQCENKMPDLDIMQQLLNKVRELKPYYLLHIGGNDICADLCGRLVPQITSSTVFSRVATSCGEYQIVDKNLTEDDVELLQILGVEPRNVKRTMFTFSFKEQSNKFTRADLGLPAGGFVLAVIGWRLDVEVTAEFLEMLCRVLEQKEEVCIAFIGKFESYDRWMVQYPLLARHSCNLGMQPDVLAVLECCDLYVNPRRNGGGSSVSEALYKGVPAVTLPMGDVSVAAGEEFWVQDYEAMMQQIICYATEPSYYQIMQEKARMRAELLMDSERSFGKTMKEIEAEIG